MSSPATDAGPIARTDLAIEVLQVRIRRDNEERGAFYRMLRATDRVLWRLENLNEAGVKVVPIALRARMRESLAELPASCLVAYRDGGRVQEVLDSVFVVQDRLFALYVPDSEREAGEDGGGEEAAG